MNRSFKRGWIVASAACVVLLLLVSFTVSASPPATEIIPPSTAPYATLSTKWWQWALSQPPGVNPVLDTTGEHCAQGQNGPIWFLAGTFGGDAVRRCTIPAGKKLFFPIANTVYIGYPTVPTDTREVAINTSREDFNNVLREHTLAVEIDGVPVTNLEDYRTPTRVFTALFPVDNLFGITANECPRLNGLFACSPSAGNGIYLMLAPLRPGRHVIHFSVSGFFDVTYRLTVEGK